MSDQIKRTVFAYFISIIVLILTDQLIQQANAQVIRDGSIGPSAATQAVGPNFIISEKFGAQQGNNLFHSFSQFGLTDTEMATFTGNAGITNIITRVTGNNISSIDGRLTSTIIGANFYLINPNGILLGANAEINVTGSFNLSTADYLTFSNGDSFNTSDINSTRLSAATPSAFGFLTNHPASITLNNSHLNLAESTDFSIVAGDINIIHSTDPAVVIRGGNILLASVASAGEVSASLDTKLESFSNLGVITLEGEEEVDGFDVSGDPNNSVILRGAVLNSTDFSINSTAEGNSPAANLAIDVQMREEINLSGSSVFASPTVGLAPAGNLFIEAPLIVLNDNSELVSDSEDAGAGGNIIISSNNLILNDDTEISSDGEGDGDGGNILIHTGTLNINDNAEISTDTDPFSNGLGGNITILADEEIRLRIEVSPGEQAGIFVNSEGNNDAGNISIATPRLDIDGGSIVASSDLSNGGNITLENELLLLGDGEIIANVNDNTGGNLSINSDTVILDSSQIVAQAGNGLGGEIFIASNRFFSSESLISASAGPAGISGSVEINAPDVNLSSGLIPLSDKIVDLSSSLEVQCSAPKAGKTSSSLTISTLKSNPSSIEGFPFNKLNSNQTESPTLIDKAIKLSNKARQLIKSGANNKAVLNAFKQAESAIDSLPVVDAKIYALIHLAKSYQQLKTSTFSSNNGYLKKAHANFQLARQLALQLEDKRAYSFAMGNFALLYQSENLIADALHLAQQALHAAELAEAPESSFRWYWLQGQLLEQHGKNRDAILSYRRAVALIEATRQDVVGSLNTDNLSLQQSIAPVYQDLVSALLQQTDKLQDPEKNQLLLIEARQIIEQYKASELRNYFNDPCIASFQAKTKTIDQISNTSAVVYPILLKDRTELIISLPDRIHRYSVAVSKPQLTAIAADFRNAIQTQSHQLHLTLGKQLFDWLITPYLSELKKQDIETLVFVPDGILRNIPLAALHDGQEFLIEKYSLAVTPGFNMIDPQPLNRSNIKMLLAGISESVGNQSSLPMVVDELLAIQKLFGGDILLNNKFTKEGIKQAFTQTQANIVHIASHAVFAGEADKNYILAYDGRFTIDDLAKQVSLTKYRDDPLELLVLSACETAAGDDRAVLGLAGAAIKAGARSALGSLWEIADQAAFEFYDTFYQALKETNLSKASAFQKAQLKLLKHKDFKHPYYWAPFLLLNNWL